VTEKKCANHPAVASITRCASCGRPLCGECWLRNVDGAPWCEQCLHHLTSRGGNVALAVAVFLASAGIAALFWRWQRSHPHADGWLLWACFVAIACVGSVYVGTRRPDTPNRVVELRPLDATTVAPPATPGYPYRSRLRAASRLVASPASGLWTASLLLSCMIVVAVALPGLLSLPRWLETEAVIAAWWAIWTGVLTTLLYRGWRLSDDHVLAPARPPWRTSETNHRTGGSDVSLNGCDLVGCGDVDGCGAVALAALAFGLILAAVWLVIELALPALFFVAYVLVRSSLARVANDQHDCEGRLGRALLWAAIWASFYALPLALVIVAIHWFQRSI
jgi:hypothetical protein